MSSRMVGRLRDMLPSASRAFDRHLLEQDPLVQPVYGSSAEPDSSPVSSVEDSKMHSLTGSQEDFGTSGPSVCGSDSSGPHTSTDSWYTAFDSSIVPNGVDAHVVRFTHLKVLASLREARKLGRIYDNSTLLGSRWSALDSPGRSCGVGDAHYAPAIQETWRNVESAEQP
ncbi:hypothetical protein LTR48_007858 [Friedmanniomyces endolithicus]|nr:hypothetical protein LTR29_007054 [Friedmanniomyces endolithicus]KAK1090664.1 hypothetical protein LTR48_007858 [Friedmanniomyces endolithicus]